jgi:hypothetical protein
MTPAEPLAGHQGPQAASGPARPLLRCPAFASCDRPLPIAVLRAGRRQRTRKRPLQRILRQLGPATFGSCPDPGWVRFPSSQGARSNRPAMTIGMAKSAMHLTDVTVPSKSSCSWKCFPQRLRCVCRRGVRLGHGTSGALVVSGTDRARRVHPSMSDSLIRAPRPPAVSPRRSARGKARSAPAPPNGETRARAP